MMQNILESNKAIVARFNKEFIEKGNLDIITELVDEQFFNHSAMPGTSTGRDGMIQVLHQVLRKAFPDIKVEIHDQVAEGDKVTTRKSFQATHTGEIMGIPPSGKKISIQVIDIIRLKDGKYIEHWGMSNFGEVLSQLAKP